MSLLDFARGPALEWSLIIMVFGVIWRLVGTFLFKGQVYLSKPKGTKFVSAGLKAIATRSWPDHRLEKTIRFQHYSGYLFHITLFIVSSSSSLISRSSSGSSDSRGLVCRPT